MKEIFPQIANIATIRPAQAYLAIKVGGSNNRSTGAEASSFVVADVPEEFAIFVAWSIVPTVGPHIFSVSFPFRLVVRTLLQEIGKGGSELGWGTFGILSEAKK